jgi:hypothetical protein
MRLHRADNRERTARLKVDMVPQVPRLRKTRTYGGCFPLGMEGT